MLSSKSPSVSRCMKLVCHREQEVFHHGVHHGDTETLRESVLAGFSHCLRVSVVSEATGLIPKDREISVASVLSCQFPGVCSTIHHHAEARGSHGDCDSLLPGIGVFVRDWSHHAGIAGHSLDANWRSAAARSRVGGTVYVSAGGSRRRRDRLGTAAPEQLGAARGAGGGAAGGGAADSERVSGGVGLSVASGLGRPGDYGAR